MDAWRTVVCGIDFTPASEAAALRAGWLARSFGGELHLAHVAYPEEHAGRDIAPGKIFPGELEFLRARLDQARERVQAATGAQARVHLLHGSAPSSLVALAREVRCDLLVLGAHAHGRVGQALGSAAGALTREAPCAILLVKTGPSS